MTHYFLAADDRLLSTDCGSQTDHNGKMPPDRPVWSDAVRLTEMVRCCQPDRDDRLKV
ncbi:hypothetical protein PM082_004470 [Marasmius tenuissimus]|nr:hypothetical protein PM082_004470 [Marasmius tenuissimus]